MALNTYSCGSGCRYQPLRSTLGGTLVTFTSFDSEIVYLFLRFVDSRNVGDLGGTPQYVVVRLVCFHPTPAGPGVDISTLTGGEGPFSEALGEIGCMSPYS